MRPIIATGKLDASAFPPPGAYDSIGSPYFTTNVGDFENSATYYGTFAQGGQRVGVERGAKLWFVAWFAWQVFLSPAAWPCCSLVPLPV